MKKETIGEVVGHPLWMLPMFMLVFLVMIESLHTTAHLRGEMDVHGLCRNNKEYIEMREEEEEDW